MVQLCIAPEKMRGAMWEMLGSIIAKPRGWPLALAVAGGVILAGRHFEISPLDKAAPEIAVAAIVAVAFGLTITAISVVSYLVPLGWSGVLALRRIVSMFVRRRTPVARLRKLTAGQSEALAWMLANEIPQVDGLHVDPFRGLVEQGYLVPQTELVRHRPRALALSSAAIKCREQIFDELQLREAEIRELKRLPPPWQRPFGWMA